MAMRREDCLDVNALQGAPLEIGMTAGIINRELTVESDTGMSHWQMRLPAGYSSDAPGYFAAGMDIYVLEGDLTVNGTLHTTACYCYIPAGVLVTGFASEMGCKLFVINGAEQGFVSADRSLETGRADKLQLGVETWKLSWLDPMKDVVERSTYKDPVTGIETRPGGVVTKTLRRDDDTNDLIILTSLASGFVDPGTEVHPHNECLYLIAGDAYIGLTYDRKKDDLKEDLVLSKDHYISRHPGIWHGPVTSQSGALWIVYLAANYTGIFGEVADWEERVGKYLANASYQ